MKRFKLIREHVNVCVCMCVYMHVCVHTHVCSCEEYEPTKENANKKRPFHRRLNFDILTYFYFNFCI